jgi:tetratricopeptide (TPR) repeat protein
VGNPAGDLGADTLGVLSSLVEKSLVRQSDVEGESRFGMLETIREFARERLVADQDHEAAAARHAEFYTRLAERAELHFTGEDQAAWLGRFEREHDNVRAALRWSIQSGEAESGLRISAAVWRFWQHHGHLTEGRQWLRELLTLPAAAPPTVARARGLGAAGSLAYWQDDLVDTKRYYEESLAAAREVGDPVAEYDAFYNLAHVPMVTGDSEGSIGPLQESLARARSLGDKRRLADALGSLAYLFFMQGEYDAALPPLEESIVLARESGNRFALAEGVETVGQIHRMLGNYGPSRAAYLEALMLKKEAGNLTGVLTTLFMLSALESAQGRHERALRLFGAASAIKDRVAGIPPMVTLLLGDPVGPARQAMGEAAATKATEDGRAMDPDAAVEYAHEQETER